MVLTQSVLCETHMFYKIGHNSGPRGSPDMILTAFDVKFHEKKDEIPPRACNPSYTFIYAILGIWGSKWNTKIIITRPPGHPQGSKVDQNDPTMSPDVLPCPKGVNLNWIKQFLKVFWGVITRVPGGPSWLEFGMHLLTISPKVFPCPKGSNFNQIKQLFNVFGGS